MFAKGAVLIAAAAVFLGVATADGPPAPRRVLHVHLPEDIVTLDWNQSVHEVDLPLILNLQEGLTMLDRDLRPVPAIAESWKYDSTGTQLKFKLRPDARWSDGKPVTAQDFVATFKRILSPTSQFSTAYFLFPIKGAEEFANGGIPDFSNVGVKATSDTTLEISFKAPAWRWVETTAVPALFPIRADILASTQNWAAPGMVTDGPFKYIRHTLKQDFLLRAREDFPGRDSNIDEINFHIMGFADAVHAFKEGKLDMIFRLPRKFRSEFKGRLDAKVYDNRPDRTRKLDINKNRDPTSRLSFRRALAEAIDRAELLRKIEAPYLPATSLVPEGMPGYQPRGGIPFNPAQAKKDLEAGGLTIGSNKIVILVPNFDDSKEEDRDIAIELKRQLESRLGVRVELQFADTVKQYLALRDSQEYHVLLRDFNVDNGDPMNFYQAYANGSRFGYTWPDREYEVMLQEAARTKSASDLRSSVGKLDDYLLKDTVTVIPLFYRGDLTVVRSNIKGFDSGAWEPYFLKRLSFIRGSGE
jgi:oligopeptide transport system substrate-binding protein